MDICAYHRCGQLALDTHAGSTIANFRSSTWSPSTRPPDHCIAVCTPSGPRSRGLGSVSRTPEPRPLPRAAPGLYMIETRLISTGELEHGGRALPGHFYQTASLYLGGPGVFITGRHLGCFQSCMNALNRQEREVREGLRRSAYGKT